MRPFLFALLLLASCRNQPEAPGILSPEKTQAVLYDVIRADEWVDFASLVDSSFRKFSKRGALYDSVFRIHYITRQQYKATMQFYQSRPDLLRDLLASLKTRADSALVKKEAADTLKKMPLN